MSKDATMKRAADLAAIAGSIKPKALSESKRLLEEGSCHEIDVTVNFKGTVTKGTNEPDAELPKSIDLITRLVVAELLSRLEVEPAKLRRLLRSIKTGGNLKASDARDAIAAEFDRVAGEISDKLPKEIKKGRAGAVRADVAITFIDTTKSRGRNAA